MSYLLLSLVLCHVLQLAGSTYVDCYCEAQCKRDCGAAVPPQEENPCKDLFGKARADCLREEGQAIKECFSMCPDMCKKEGAVPPITCPPYGSAPSLKCIYGDRCCHKYSEVCTGGELSTYDTSTEFFNINICAPVPAIVLG